MGNASAAYPIARFDYAIDENNVDVVTPPDPGYKQKPRFVGNMHNKLHLRPCGFFRKVGRHTRTHTCTSHITIANCPI